MNRENLQLDFFSDTINEGLIKTFNEEKKTEKLQNRLNEYLKGIVTKYIPNASTGSIDAIVKDNSELMNAFSNAVIKEYVKHSDDLFFEKSLGVIIQKADLPFFNKDEKEKEAREYLLENALGTSVSVRDEATLQVLTTIVASSLVLGYISLKTTAKDKVVTFNDLIHEVTKVFYAEAFDKDE